MSISPLSIEGFVWILFCFLYFLSYCEFIFACICCIFPYFVVNLKQKMRKKNCVCCGKQTRPERRRSLKGGKNQRCRQEVGIIFRKSITEEDFLCNLCNTKYHRGQLEATNIKPDGVNIPVFSIGTKSHKYCCICGHKPNNLKTVPADAHTLLFLKHKIILSACSRCCPSHLNDNKTIKDEAIISNKHRLKESTKTVKSDEMIKILTFAKSLLEKSESR